MSDTQRDRRPERIKSNDWDATRKKILRRDGRACQFCGIAESAHQDRFDTGLHIHHIRPREHMGSDHPENLITVCSRCHKTAEMISNHMIETELEREHRELEARTDKQELVGAGNALHKVHREIDVEIEGLEEVAERIFAELEDWEKND